MDKTTFIGETALQTPIATCTCLSSSDVLNRRCPVHNPGRNAAATSPLDLAYFEVRRDGVTVASVNGRRDFAEREALKYAAQYEADGPVEVIELVKIYETEKAPLVAGASK